MVSPCLAVFERPHVSVVPADDDLNTSSCPDEGMRSSSGTARS